jgi:hypothetical protein
MSYLDMGTLTRTPPGRRWVDQVAGRVDPPEMTLWRVEAHFADSTGGRGTRPVRDDRRPHATARRAAGV